MTSAATPAPVGQSDDCVESDKTPALWIALSTLPILIGAFLQRFGEIISNARLDRILDPFTMAWRGFDLWNPYWDMGALQFQQNGYWFPFDLWFGATKALHIPTWISQRLFIYAIIALALWGFVRLADAFKIGRPSTRLVAGLAYAISPIVLSRVGGQSPTAMGVVLLPWVILPLVRSSKIGSVRKGAAQSAIAIALIGGANAAVTIAILPLPFLYLITRTRGPRRASLLRWWIPAVPMATLWWISGIFFFGKFGPDVLQYTESVEVTTSATSLFDVLRGTADWWSQYSDGSNTAGSSLYAGLLPIIATSVVAATGIAGLARRRLPERTFLLTSLLLGVAAVGGGFGGLFGNPGDAQYRALLDGALNAFRTVYKFQGLIALPLAFGVAYGLAGLLDLNLFGNRAFLKRLLAAITIVVLAFASWPLWTNSLTRGPGATKIPSAWIEANSWLSENSPGRALVLPGIPSADFDWGFTAQIPIQWGSDVTWATRSQAPLSGVEIIEYLDTTEAVIERGGDTGLVDYLRRGGFTSVVVPNDQRSEKYGAPPPETIRRAMIASGFSLTVAFGDRAYGNGNLQQVDIYSVPGGAVATTYAASSATWLSGDIASTLAIPKTTFGDRPYFLVRDHIASPLQPSQWIITDGNQATTITYGLNRDNKSYIHGPNDDIVPPGQNADDLTVQQLAGFSSVTASSVGAGVFRRNNPEYGPANIVDGDSTTWWVPQRYLVKGPEQWGPTDPYVDVVFSEPTKLDQLDISLYLGFYTRRLPIDVTVQTDAGIATTQLQPIQSKQRLNVISGTTNSVKVAIARSSYGASGEIGIRELNVPGAPASPRLIVPDQLNTEFSSPGAPDPAWVFTRNRPPISSSSSLNSEKQISRGFTVPKAAKFRALASASSTRSYNLLTWLGTTPTFSISADSTWENDPNISPRNLVDRSATTAWRSGTTINPSGGNSLISMKWNTPRILSSLKLVRSETGAMPTDVVISSGDETRVAPVAADGSVEFAPLATSSIKLQINYAPVALDDKTSSKQIGLSSIEIPAIADLYPGPIDRAAPYTAGCGSGPVVTIGATKISYLIATTTGALIDGTPFDLLPCGSDSVSLSAGSKLLDASSGTSLAKINRIVLGNSPTMALASGTPRDLSIDHWGTNQRTVTVASGSEGLLVVNEMFNEGWEATLNGTKLAPIVIDGWRQGFVVLAGDGGVVQLRFAPDRIFKIITTVGLLTLLALLILALWPDRKKRQLDAIGEGQPAKTLLIAGVLIGAVWCTGIGAVLLLPVWWVRNRRRNWLPLIAFLSMSSTGLLVLISNQIDAQRSNLWGVSSYPVSALAATAFLCALVTLLPRRRKTDDGSATTWRSISVSE